ncbi:RnfH family protein [Ectothiorhodospira variabilis]|uniref:RnfH family protein n=1 Tax=Ectothiorhodospira variabilis TaxID=505694 RepID=UPI001EFB8978|nr:RnfH family protein [Ectothiorhodospira variabilis]MCG5494090.1 RnfH family protein [Ectothiorhodospira variabilis]MCG5497977.1 RnfH family protein [Ectothiorhodospira variabilis]MCG5503380.1 RnfH family protein [Ectothiorhodospira variabilis]MCG5506532.1 RnfH family protein [Ectothiorhodospira variabilis]
MRVGVAYSDPNDRAWLKVDLPEGATVQQAIEQSGILKRFPDIDLDTQKVGIFGKFCKLDNPVQDGDRVEIYRPITVVDDDDDEDDDDD